MNRRRPLRSFSIAALGATAALGGCDDGREEPAPVPQATSAQAARVEAPTALPASLKRIAGDQAFSAPVAMAAAPDGSRRLFVAERGGRVVVVSPSGSFGTTPIFLDLKPVLGRTSAEDGLLGLAIHPDYAKNRALFLSYVRPGPMRLTVSRFRASEADPNRVEEDSEQRLLEIKLPFDTHRGGGLAVSPEGHLYIGVGDGGGHGDPYGHARNLRSLLGKVLRLDVDAVGIYTEYAIPLSNPYRGNRDDVPEEIFAHGFCNPRHLGLDGATGRVWAADSGGTAGEEIDRVEPGKFYGWGPLAPARAGAPTGPPTPRASQPPVTPPLHAYRQPDGEAITGVVAYHGQRWPALRGKLIFADRKSGQVWVRGMEAKGQPTRLLTHPKGIVALAEDADGEVLLMTGEGHLAQLD